MAQRSGLWRAVLSAIMALAALEASSQAPPTLEQCDERFAGAPDERRSYNCYWFAARARGAFDAAASRLESILRAEPGHPAALHNLARIEDARGHEQAEELFRMAIEGYASQREEVGLLWALLDLAFFLGERGRDDEADRAVEDAAEVAERLDDPALRVKVGIMAAIQAENREDYGRALRFYHGVEALAADDSTSLQDVLGGLGRVAHALGRHTESITYLRREADLIRSSGNALREAVARYNIALETEQAWGAGEVDRAVFDRTVEEALGVAVRSGNRNAEASTRLLRARYQDPPVALVEIEQAEAILEATEHWDSSQFAIRLRADKTLDLGQAHHAEAFRLIEVAIARARAAGDLDNAARAMVTRAAMAARAGTHQQAIDAHCELFSAVERLRDLQPEATIRARHFSRWLNSYQAFVDHLLQGFHFLRAADGELDLAFHTIERGRARMLLDLVGATIDALPPEADPSIRTEHNRALTEIAHSQRQLMDPGLQDEARHVLLARLAVLEIEEQGLRDRLARTGSRRAELEEPVFPTLLEVQETLAPDQAMLLFELRNPRREGGRSGPPGPSFVLAIHREGIWLYRVPAQEEIEERTAIFNGLLLEQGEVTYSPAVRLYRDLLDEVLRTLPDEVTRLVIVPAGPLHRVPFEALRSPVRASPVGARYEVCYAPSATIWMRLRNAPERAHETRVLALADPPVARTGPYREGGPWRTGLQVQPLPFARREALELARQGGDGSLVLSGAEASERLLKEIDLSAYRVLHLATHALVDDAQPQRSAVLLAPGGEGEDGLLQMPEIVTLDLTGTVVILSACSSATGELLLGEGVLGLTHAFFLAGAQAVVGATHPVRDEDTARLMGDFAAELGRGRSVAAALAGARRRSIGRGDPVGAWAGLVVLGDGDAIPLAAAAGARRRAILRRTVAIGAALCTALVLLLITRRRR